LGLNSNSVSERQIAELFEFLGLDEDGSRPPLSTSDALAILRAVAGQITLTDAQIAKFGISGEPATADAMRILRVVAGF
jgi:hypothetical protein